MPRPTPSAAETQLKLDDFLCFAVYSAGHAFTRVYKPLLDRLGLTYPQYLVMVILWEEDKQTVGSLADRLFLESSTLTPLLKRLEAMDLVSRRRDQADERIVRIELTGPGRALREQARNVPDCIADASGLDSAELKQLQQQINALRESLAAARSV
jgi:DNA-binding MarR family transcriptional regulator